MYEYSHLEDYIEDLYRKIEIETASQLNVHDIAELLNVRLRLLDGTSEALCLRGVHYIFVNQNDTSAKQWQDFGHELCHILWHAGKQLALPPPFRQMQEWQADNFMLHFCIPTFMLAKIRLPDDSNSAALLLVDLFGVEYHFARRRLVDYQTKCCNASERRQLRAMQRNWQR